MAGKIKTRQELIRAYIDFFKSHNHREIPSASLIPENDPTALFNSAGMQPLVPFLLGERHPLGKRITNVQKCIRTGDIDEVGDEVHHTFFEMLGNWSLGDYWKKEAITWTYEFLTKVLGFEKDRLAVTVFGGDDRVPDVPSDKEAKGVWLSLGVEEERIAPLKRGVIEKENNWWGPVGESGPCGPCTEIFYWTPKEPAPRKYDPNDDRWVEIGNDVLMEYNRTKRTILVDGMFCLYDDKFNLNHELLDILLKSDSKKILVVNGYAKEAKDLVGQYGIEVFSFNGEIKKDNPEFFARLLEKHSLSPDEVIYFDHDIKNLSGARGAGIVKTMIYSENPGKIEEFISNNTYSYKRLAQRNVDFGGGVERTLAILNGFSDNYMTSVFQPIIHEIEKISGKNYSEESNKKAMRVIADHIRAAVFVLGDPRGVKPSNTGQGYVLRRLIRRAVRYGNLLGIENNFTTQVAKAVLPVYNDYQELHRNQHVIMQELEDEETKFRKTLEKGLKKFNDIATDQIITGTEAFLLFQSYGFPIEMTQELAEEKGVKVDLESYNEEFRKHQDLSRTASAGQFKSGLADDSEATKKLHTATHLLNEALRRILGKDVHQKGSNITPERLRFDFNFPRKLTPEEIKQVESLINQKISEGLDVEREEVPLQDATASGAQAEFGMKYPDLVSVYTILDPSEEKGWFSREICTGPHVRNTSEIGHFRIQKEESSSAGVRRIKAIVE